MSIGWAGNGRGSDAELAQFAGLRRGSVNAILGRWLVVAPFVLGYARVRIVVVDLVVGVLLVGLSGLSALLTYRQRAKSEVAGPGE
jgi:hypothetical protein